MNYQFLNEELLDSLRRKKAKKNKSKDKKQKRK